MAVYRLCGIYQVEYIRLNHFPNNGVNCYVKRDDELGCGISGSKLRKYASLLPFLMNKGITDI